MTEWAGTYERLKHKVGHRVFDNSAATTQPHPRGAVSRCRLGRANPLGHCSRALAARMRSGWFAKAVAESAIPRATPHDLRHAASLAVSAGANVKAVQKMLGHASAAMTLDIYADLFDDDLEAVATALHDARSREIVGKIWARGGHGATDGPPDEFAQPASGSNEQAADLRI